MLADAAIRGGAFGDSGSGRSRDEGGLGSKAEDGAGAVADGEDGVADCCAFAHSVRNREAEITQYQIRIIQPRFRFLPSSSTSKQRFSGGRARGRRHPQAARLGVLAVRPVGVCARYVV